MSLVFEVEERIGFPPAVVWRHLSEPALLAEWMTGCEDFRTLDGGPVKAGSRMVYKARGSERTAEVVAFEAGRRIDLRSSQGGFTATYGYGLEPDGPDGGPDGGASRVTLAADCAATGPIRLLAPFLKPLIRKADQGQLARLRTAVERAQAPSGA